MQPHSISLVLEITKALLYLHSRGVYHGDLKPGNILVETKNLEKKNGANPPRKGKGVAYYLGKKRIKVML